MRKPRPADAQAIFSRLVARNEQLDRQLRAFLAAQGLSPSVLELAAARGGANDPRIAEARQRIARELDERSARDGAASWETISRPSAGAIAAACGGRLLRA